MIKFEILACIVGITVGILTSSLLLILYGLIGFAFMLWCRKAT